MGKKPTNLPKIIPMSLEVEVGEKKVKRSKVTIDSDIELWGTTTFAKYFEYLYQTKFMKPYILNKADLAQMKRIIKLRDNETIKEYMEKFIELDYFPAKTLRIFCSSYTQTSLDKYFTDGNLPYSKDQGVGNEPSELEEWSKSLDDVFGGGGE